MIKGSVNARYEVLIPIKIRDSRGHDHEIETILDTGFTGSLTLQSSLIAMLGLTWRPQSSAVLADGSIEQFDVYSATVIWDGVPRPILIQAIDNDAPLGMTLLSGHELRVRVTPGGAAEIESMA